MVPTATPVEFFPPLTALDGVCHAFLTRIPGVCVEADRDTVLEHLKSPHDALRTELGLGGSRRFLIAEQVHGAEVVRVNRGSLPDCAPGADALATDDPGVCLGIYVADCAAVYIADPVRRAVALAHSGRKGTELGILPKTIARMGGWFGSVPEDLVVVISPCIRPPLYEQDFAADIRRQAAAAGVRRVNDAGTCTGSDTERYYSYRVEKGRTGRMLALLAVE